MQDNVSSLREAIRKIDASGMSAAGTTEGQIPVANGDDTWSWMDPADVRDKLDVPAINDNGTSTADTWSASKINSTIQGLPVIRYDKAQSLTTAQKNQALANIGATSVTGNVRYDAGQSLTEAQKQQARTNIGAQVAKDGTMAFKGNVAAVSNLPTGAAKGDMYTVAGDVAYVWTGSKWQPLGSATSGDVGQRLDDLEDAVEQVQETVEGYVPISQGTAKSRSMLIVDSNGNVAADIPTELYVKSSDGTKLFVLTFSNEGAIMISEVTN